MLLSQQTLCKYLGKVIIGNHIAFLFPIEIIFFLFQILLLYKLSQNIGQSSLCYTAIPSNQLFHIPQCAYICQSHTSNPSLPPTCLLQSKFYTALLRFTPYKDEKEMIQAFHNYNFQRFIQEHFLVGLRRIFEIYSSTRYTSKCLFLYGK